jgi:PAS domain S-box-containing protein
VSASLDSTPPTRPPRPPSWRTTVLAALIVPSILGALALWNASENHALQQARANARASYDKRLLIYDLVGSIEQAETAQRGFIITGDDRFLAPYVPGRRATASLLAQIRRASNNTPSQAAILDRVEVVVRDKFAEMDDTMARRRADGLNEAIARINDGEGRALMDRLRSDAAALRQEEERLSAQDLRAVQDHMIRTSRVIDVTFIIAILLFLLAITTIWRQHQQRYRANLAAYDAAERNRAILEGTIDPIVILNPSGSIESLNRAAEKLLGFTPAEVVRRDVSSIAVLPPDENLPFPDRVGLKEGRIAVPYRTDVPLRHRDGHVVTVDAALGVMHLPDGEHIVVSLRDVSERKRAEATKDELISTISHELRTPLTSVVGALGLLRVGSVGALPEGAARLIGIAESNARRLIRLINDMLDIDRLQSGQLHIEREPVDLAALAMRACSDMQDLGRDRLIKVTCEMDAGPLIVIGDADRLMQVIGNLVSNAVRVSPSDATVAIAATRADGLVCVTVEDQGPGVPAAFRDRIFRRFERADEKQGAGTGLGLAISREIIQRHDGRIWFEDREGGGTRFAFSLDLVRDVATQTAAADSDAGTRVLVCEDDADSACLLKEAVAAAGYVADVVSTAEAARSALANGNYAALLLDLNLPDENGLHLANALRTDDGSTSIPIIIVSAAVRGADSPVPFGFVDWIEKPVDARRLADAINIAVSRSGAIRPTILHLDDDRDVLDITSALFGGDARLLKVSDLASARTLLEHETPDVAILDLHLVDGNGLDLLPHLVDANGVAIPTIVYSAYNVSADIAAQVDAVLIKSRRSLPDLKATIRRILRAQKEET